MEEGRRETETEMERGGGYKKGKTIRTNTEEESRREGGHGERSRKSREERIPQR